MLLPLLLTTNPLTKKPPLITTMLTPSRMTMLDFILVRMKAVMVMLPMVNTMFCFLMVVPKL